MLSLSLAAFLFFQPPGADSQLAGRVHQFFETFSRPSAPEQMGNAAEAVERIFSSRGLLTIQEVGDEASYEFAYLACLVGEPDWDTPRKAHEAAKRKQIPSDAAVYCEAATRQQAVKKKAEKIQPRNSALRDQIEKLSRADQAVRQKDGFDRDTLLKVDRQHAAELEQIFSRYGAPTYDMVGVSAASAFVAMIQHQSADFRRRVLPRLKGDVERGQAGPDDYAMMLDRSLSESGKKQVFGENLVCDGKHLDAQIGIIEDEKHVNQRRAEVGLMRLELYVRFTRELNPPCATSDTPATSRVQPDPK